jgi:galactose mutarotase-like enzyme
MNAKINNGLIQLCTRNKGAEMISLLDLRDGTEHLWQADPAVWPWHAPMLFPVIGACEHQELRIGNARYPMQKHGLARHADFRLLEQRENSLHFLLESKGQFLNTFPWEFELHVFYTLEENRLHCTYEVVNMDESDMYFALGGHPAFSICWEKEHLLSDYYLQFQGIESAKRHLINEQGLFNGLVADVFQGSDRIPLSEHLFTQDALIFKDLQSKAVMLKCHKSDKYLSFNLVDYPYLGIWAVAGAKYVCIEPWQGCAETAGTEVQVMDKEKVLCLSPKTAVSRSFSVEIHQK